MSWTDPENELVAVIMLPQPRGSMQRDFAKAIQAAIIEQERRRFGDVMRRLYSYVGPPEIAESVGNNPNRVHVTCSDDVRRWLTEGSGQRATATFIIDESGELWIADRRSEHVACACGGPVLSAGEMTFEAHRDGIDVVYVTNQSTGFCPEPQSWSAVASALDKAGIAHNEDFDLRCEFRRCVCGQRNIVKNDIFECGVCGADLPLEWNFDTDDGT